MSMDKELDIPFEYDSESGEFVGKIMTDGDHYIIEYTHLGITYISQKITPEQMVNLNKIPIKLIKKDEEENN